MIPDSVSSGPTGVGSNPGGSMTSRLLAYLGRCPSRSPGDGYSQGRVPGTCSVSSTLVQCSDRFPTYRSDSDKYGILQQFVEDMRLEEAIETMVEPGLGFYNTVMVPRKGEEVEN